jgi:hypothetical protein
MFWAMSFRSEKKESGAKDSTSNREGVTLGVDKAR